MIGSRRLCVPAVLCLCSLSIIIGAGCNGVSDKLHMDPAKACIDARHVLRRASQDRNPLTRAKAIEALAATLGSSAGGTYLEGLNDSEPNVRFAAAVAIGDLKYAPAKSKLLSMARYKVAGAERDSRVYAGVIYALYRLGNTEHISDLGPMLDSPDKEIRGNAVLVIGRMGEPSAIKPLKSLYARERDVVVRVQVLEARAMLGDEYSARMIEACVDKPTLAERLIAVRTLGRLQSVRSAMILRTILNSPEQIIRARVMAAGSLGQLGEVSDYGYNLCLTSVRQPREVMAEAMRQAAGGKVQAKALNVDIISLQRLAAISLGWMKRPQAVDVLHPLLKMKNRDGGVRVAAAMSILRLLADQDDASPPKQAAEKSGGAESKLPSDPRKRPKLKTSPWK